MDLGGRYLLALARALMAVTAAAGARLYVNGRVDVALACGAAGVHLPGDGLSVAEVRAMAPALSVAVSTHAPPELEAAARAGAAFAVFGPVFDTPSKRGRLTPVGLEGLAQAARAAALPVIALGGIDFNNASACMRAGAAGVACNRAVLGAGDPACSTEELFTSFHREKPDSRG
jgi:thiamine-phosphate pyrophosphorylase